VVGICSGGASSVSGGASSGSGGGDGTHTSGVCVGVSTLGAETFTIVILVSE
jgi:hypothetical protein